MYWSGFHSASLNGPGAHPLRDPLIGRELLGDLLGIDRRHVVGHGQRDEHDARLLLELHLDGVLVHRLEIDHLREERLAVDGALAPASERRDHVVRRHLLAVVEADALSELEGVDEPVLGDGVALRQHGDRLVALVERVEALEDVVRQHLRDGLRAPVRVERGRLAEVADAEHAALFRCLRLRHPGGHGHQGHQGQRQSSERQRSCHTCPPRYPRLTGGKPADSDGATSWPGRRPASRGEEPGLTRGISR